MNWALPPRPAKVVRPWASPPADVQEPSSAVSDPSKLSLARSMCLPCQRRALDNRYVRAASTSVNRAEQLQVHHETDPTGEREAAPQKPPDEGSCHMLLDARPTLLSDALGALGIVAGRSILPREACFSVNRVLHPPAARPAPLGAGLVADTTSRLPSDALDTRQHRLVDCLASPARWVLCSAAGPNFTVLCRFYDINHKLSRSDIRYLA
jgi:hypothetical protein